jgi:general secretion pathway protein A
VPQRGAGGSAARGVGTEPVMPGGMAGAVLDLDLTQLKLDPETAENLSKQIDALAADQRGDQLQRLERGLLRLERINVQTLSLLQTLVKALTANEPPGAAAVQPPVAKPVLVKKPEQPKA